mmetsp:Transcript_32850/g.94367  ORF Transcript_32850/g.94367 Transcript_32850/m.94367 type:complete len:306 (-) Transcript_32850:734-1651(-)
MLLRLLGVAPLEPQLVEAVGLLWEAEVPQRAAQGLRRHVGRLCLAEDDLLLVIRKFHLWRVLVGPLVVVVLILIVVLASDDVHLLRSLLVVAGLRQLPPLLPVRPPLVQLPVALVGGPPPLLVGLLRPELHVSLLLLLLQHELTRPLLEVSSGLPHHDAGHLGEQMGRELGHQLRALFRHQVASQLHDHDAPRQHPRGHLQHRAEAAVLELREAEAHLGLVVGGPLGVRPLPRHPAPLGPVQDRAVAELRVARVLLQEHVQPVKDPLARQAHGQDDLPLPLRVLRVGGDDGVLEGDVLHHSAGKG